MSARSLFSSGHIADVLTEHFEDYDRDSHWGCGWGCGCGLGPTVGKPIWRHADWVGHIIEVLEGSE